MKAEEKLRTWLAEADFGFGGFRAMIVGINKDAKRGDLAAVQKRTDAIISDWKEMKIPLRRLSASSPVSQGPRDCCCPNCGARFNDLWIEYTTAMVGQRECYKCHKIFELTRLADFAQFFPAPRIEAPGPQVDAEKTDYNEPLKLAKQRVDIVERIMKLGYIKATRDAERGEERFVCRDDVIKAVHDYAVVSRSLAALQTAPKAKAQEPGAAK